MFEDSGLGHSKLPLVLFPEINLNIKCSRYLKPVWLLFLKRKEKKSLSPKLCLVMGLWRPLVCGDVSEFRVRLSWVGLWARSRHPGQESVGKAWASRPWVSRVCPWVLGCTPLGIQRLCPRAPALSALVRGSLASCWCCQASCVTLSSPASAALYFTNSLRGVCSLL